MSLYLVALVSPHKGVWDQLTKNWPNRHYIISDRMALVAPEGISTAESIADVVGISTDSNAATGVVVPLDAHSGVLQAGAVDWMRAVQRG